MRSLKYLLALLPLQFINVLGAKEFDATVVVTTTRTVTFCPIANLFDCPAPTAADPHHWGDWGVTVTDTATSASTTSTKSSDGSTTSSGYGHGTGSTTRTGTVSTSSHSGGDGATTSTLTTTSRGGNNGNGTTTTTALTTTTTGFSNGTSTTTTTSISSCNNATHTAAPLKDTICNGPNSRSSWCGGKSVSVDTDDIFSSGAPLKKFDLRISEAQLNFDGSAQSALAINGKSPGEAIEVNWGDVVEITVHNDMATAPTTIHWHGILQKGTNDQDGVPGVTECAIAPGSSRTYTWLASTYGTGWYHSHTVAQYGAGIRGPIIVHGPATANYDLDMGAVMINEKFNNTIEAQAKLAATTPGQLAPAANYLLNGKNKNLDQSAGENAKWIVKSGKKHLFRFINSGAQSAYIVHIDNHKMKVISADFTPVTPYETEFLYIQGGQRYNVIVEMNQAPGAYFLRAITQTGCGTACANNGMGLSNGIIEYEESCGAKPVPQANLTVVTSVCRDEYANLSPFVPKGAGSVAKFNEVVKLMPAGNAGVTPFAQYGAIVRWFFGPLDNLNTNSASKKANQTISVDFKQPTLKTLATLPDLAYNSSLYSNAVALTGPKNDWVYFVIQNNFQTSHPMHLHGHDFAILGQGEGVFDSSMISALKFDNPIRRDTALLFGAPVVVNGVPQTGPNAPARSGYTVIGFKTDNPGAWVMHCHIIWHADGGMGLQFIERPDDIQADKYYGQPEFQNECSAYENFEKAGGSGKLIYESGLKKRHLDAHKFHGFHAGSLARH